MQVTDELIRNVVSEVLAHMRNGSAPAARDGQAHAWGVYEDVDQAVAAAKAAQAEFERRGLAYRRKAVACIRKICIDQAEPLGRAEFDETRIGRLKHKIEKLVVAAEKTLGVEFLKSDAFSGENGIAIQEYAPFGVVG